MSAPSDRPDGRPSPSPASLPPAYFDALYAESPDPWDFEKSAYEAAKYEATLAALPRARYERALEIGCSIGVLTQKLAARCERLLSVDVSAKALATARARCRGLSHVRFERRSIPEEFPEGRFDLVLVSEVGYYWSREDLARARQWIEASLVEDGHLLLVHWTPYVEDYPLTGDEVHEAFLAASRGSDAALQACGGGREQRYRLDLFRRR